MNASIFDIHMYFGKSLFGRNLEKQDIQEIKDKYPGLGGCFIPCKPYDYMYGKINEEVENVGETFVGTWEYAVRVDPWRVEEAISLIQASKSPLLFLHPFEEQIYPTHPFFYHIVEEAIEKKMKIMIACGYVPFSHSAQVMPLIKDFPNAKFIITHGGQINICGMHMDEAFEIFRENKNTYFETSGIYRQDYIEKAINELGSERVLFGSGAPYYDIDFELKRIAFLNVSDSIKEKILGKNARILLKLL